MQRIEGLAKLTGAERYIDDLPFDGALWGMTVRSPVPRGRIKSISYGPGVDWAEFVVVDHRDIPGRNVVRLIEDDQPVLAAEHVRHVHEAVALIAHESRDMVRRALGEITIDIDPEPAIFDFAVTPPQGTVQHGTANVLSELSIVKGDVDAALADAAHVIEGVYTTGAQEHVYIEPQGMVAWVEDDVVVVQGSMQCPYYIVNALTYALGREQDAVRVLHAATGGGFGGKEDYPSIIALHTALLAMKAGRPVKMIYDRTEDMVATTKRHPAQVRHVTGVDADGRLLAQKIDVVLDGGAYVTLSPVVLSRGIIHAGGPYSCANVRIDGKAILTNSVPFGAFRGFGAPQTQFANERHMDVVAQTLGMCPSALRHINLIADGETTSTGQVIHDGADRQAVLDRAMELSDYSSRRAKFTSANREHPYLKRGIGLATFYHGAGFTGSGEVHLKSRVRMAARPDGRVEVRTANTEMGQGTGTVFTQIVVRSLGLEPNQVVIAPVDTRVVPNSGPTVASRTTMVVGGLLERACDQLRAALGLSGEATGTAVRDAILQRYAAQPGNELLVEAKYVPPAGIVWDDTSYRGDAYATFAWATYIAEVEVDLRTYGVRTTDFVAVQDVGTVLNPTLARGQIQGGVVQGIGWALMESCVWENGAMANGQMTNYIIPTSDDVPPIRVDFLVTPYPGGAQGSKGLGELPIDGVAPAILNAVADAIGVNPTTVPLTPEHLMEFVAHAQSDPC